MESQPPRPSFPIGRASRKDPLRLAAASNMLLRNTHLSMCHALVFLDGGAVYIEDLQLTFGTVLNEHILIPHAPAELASGDRVGFVVHRPSAVLLELRTQNAAPVSLKKALSPPVQMHFRVELDGRRVLFHPTNPLAKEACRTGVASGVCGTYDVAPRVLDFDALERDVCEPEASENETLGDEEAFAETSATLEYDEYKPWDLEIEEDAFDEPVSEYSEHSDAEHDHDQDTPHTDDEHSDDERSGGFCQFERAEPVVWLCETETPEEHVPAAEQPLSKKRRMDELPPSLPAKRHRGFLKLLAKEVGKCALVSLATFFALVKYGQTLE